MSRPLSHFLTLLTAAALALAACSPQTPGEAGEPEAHAAQAAAGQAIPTAALQPVNLEGHRLRVVATTSIIGDTVQRVAGNHVDLTVLLPIGSDPHSYTATPQDMIAMSDADVIFVNGLGLEESLLPTIDAIEGVPVVSINEGITPIQLDEHSSEDVAEVDHAHGGVDPHTWLDVRNVRQWALTAATALGTLDPGNAPAYRQAGDAYAAELSALHQEILGAVAPIPPEARKLVTDHDTLRYFAAAYGYEVIGSVIPSFSTLSTISAQEMAALQEQIKATGARAVFADASVNPRLAQQVAQDTGIAFVRLYTGSLGPAGSPESTYTGMMRTNVKKILAIGTMRVQDNEAP